MNSLDRKLVRDLWHTRGQVIAIALVVVCGLASFVLARSAYTSLTLTQKTYYEDRIGAIINGKWERLKIVGIALSPEYVYEVRGGGELYPDNKRFGIIWMGREALGKAYDLDGAFNNVTLSLSPGAKEIEVITQLV